MKTRDSLYINIQNVDVFIGSDLKIDEEKYIYLGSLPTRCLLDGHIVTNIKLDAYANKQQCIEICGMSMTRNDWEKELRHTLGSTLKFKEMFLPTNTTDWFVVRLNPVRKLLRCGWDRNEWDTRRKMRKEYGNQ